MEEMNANAEQPDPRYERLWHMAVRDALERDHAAMDKSYVSQALLKVERRISFGMGFFTAVALGWFVRVILMILEKLSE